MTKKIEWRQLKSSDYVDTIENGGYNPYKRGEKMYIYLITLTVLLFLFQLIRETKTKKRGDQIDYAKSYQARYLLTRNEWQQYKKLKEIADKRDLIICPKVRLLDIIEPKRGTPHYKTLFNKVQSKHVDFTVCDRDMNIKYIIELDDASHDSEDRKERDEFVDTILKSVGYKVIHTRYITNEILLEHHWR